MNRNVKIAKQLLKLAKSLVAVDVPDEDIVDDYDGARINGSDIDKAVSKTNEVVRKILANDKRACNVRSGEMNRYDEGMVESLEEFGRTFVDIGFKSSVCNDGFFFGIGVSLDCKTFYVNNTNHVNELPMREEETFASENEFLARVQELLNYYYDNVVSK